mmetsp:Transcript_49218/g.157414  ORF Transcript_49218/g.157414 Transcript_49218/m.157414 type:complete len:294 (+) Transcript_49218:1199-2080(+)
MAVGLAVLLPEPCEVREEEAGAPLGELPGPLLPALEQQLLVLAAQVLGLTLQAALQPRGPGAGEVVGPHGAEPPLLRLQPRSGQGAGQGAAGQRARQRPGHGAEVAAEAAELRGLEGLARQGAAELLAAHGLDEHPQLLRQAAGLLGPCVPQVLQEQPAQAAGRRDVLGVQPLVRHLVELPPEPHVHDRHGHLEDAVVVVLPDVLPRLVAAGGQEALELRAAPVSSVARSGGGTTVLHWLLDDPGDREVPRQHLLLRQACLHEAALQHPRDLLLLAEEGKELVVQDLHVVQEH